MYERMKTMNLWSQPVSEVTIAACELRRAHFRMGAFASPSVRHDSILECVC